MASDGVVNAMDRLILQGHSVFFLILYSHPEYNVIILRSINLQTSFHRFVVSADLDFKPRRSRPFRPSRFCGASPQFLCPAGWKRGGAPDLRRNKSPEKVRVTPKTNHDEEDDLRICRRWSRS